MEATVSLVTDTVTPVFRVEGEQGTAFDRVLQLEVSARAAASHTDAAVGDSRGTYGPEYCPMPRSMEEARAQDSSKSKPTTIAEARALEAERPLASEEARESGKKTPIAQWRPFGKWSP